MKRSPSSSYSVYKVIENGKVPEKVIEDFKKFCDFVSEQSKTASKYTHYDKLAEWSGTVFGYVDKMLKKYKFVNGGAAMGIPQNPEANFWWLIYSVVSNVIYSPHLKSEVVSHHSSAYERNEALIMELSDIVELNGIFNGLDK